MRPCGFYRAGVDLTPATVEHIVAEGQVYRAMAVKNGLDPDLTFPDDLCLLDSEKNGELVVVKDEHRAVQRCRIEYAKAKADWAAEVSKHAERREPRSKVDPRYRRR